jgi:hypothetical protein
MVVVFAFLLVGCPISLNTDNVSAGGGRAFATSLGPFDLALCVNYDFIFQGTIRTVEDVDVREIREGDILQEYRSGVVTVAVKAVYAGDYAAAGDEVVIYGLPRGAEIGESSVVPGEEFVFFAQDMSVMPVLGGSFREYMSESIFTDTNGAAIEGFLDDIDLHCGASPLLALPVENGLIAAHITFAEERAPSIPLTDKAQEYLDLGIGSAIIYEREWAFYTPDDFAQLITYCREKYPPGSSALNRDEPTEKTTFLSSCARQ